MIFSASFNGGLSSKTVATVASINWRAVLSAGEVVALTWFLFSLFFFIYNILFFVGCSCQHKSLPAKEAGGIKKQKKSQQAAPVEWTRRKSWKMVQFRWSCCSHFCCILYFFFFCGQVMMMLPTQRSKFPVKGNEARHKCWSKIRHRRRAAGNGPQ